jgi:AhpD family alkylhydroperoxidase
MRPHSANSLILIFAGLVSRTEKFIVSLTQTYAKVNVKMSMETTLKEVQSLVEKISEQYPKLAGPFMVFLRRVEEEGVLSTKTKELISVALAVACRCKWCIAFHTKNALDAGATKDEIMEACFVATLMAGGPALMYAQLVLEAIDEFTKAKEKIKVPEKATK